MRHFTTAIVSALALLVFAGSTAEAATVTLRWDPPTDPTTTGHVLWYGTQSRTYSHRIDLGLQTSYTATDLTAGVLYYFALTAYNAAGDSSAFSTEITSSPGLGAPRNLSGRATGSNVELVWESPTPGVAFDYVLEVGSSPGASNLGVLPVGAVTSFAASGVPHGIYYVRVKAIRSGVAGPASNEITLAVGASCHASPGPPTGLAANATGPQVVVTWRPGGGGGADGYLLEAGTAPGLADIGSIPVAGTSFSALAPDGTYFLRVRSVNGCGRSAPSNEVSVTVSDPSKVRPNAPVNVTAAVNGATVTIRWNAAPNGGPPERFILDVKTADDNPIGTLDVGNVLSFTHPGTPPGTYRARVRAVNAAGMSPPSNMVTITVGSGAPVDCVLSPWTLSSAGPWSACVGGQQSRTETWTRSIITYPENGGAACGPLTETRTATQGCGAVSGNLITLDPSEVHQTMRGWEVMAQASHHSAAFPSYAGAVFDANAALGINRIRLEVRSGSENTTDSFGQWAAAGFPSSGSAYTTWRAKRYETINDNSDPNVINAAGFKWTEVDDTIDLLVNPLRQRLAARGESLYVNLNYVAFTSQITSGRPYIHNQPAEYAEFMLALFQHLQAKYGWVPDAIEVILEPDNISHWNDYGKGMLVGQAIVAAGQRLAAAGFRPDFIAPSTTCMGNAIDYFDQLIAVPNVTAYMKEVAYHRYCGVSTSNLQAIASRAAAHGVATSMLEWWDGGNTHHTLHEDLKVGRNSAWQQAPLAGLNDPGGLAIVNVDTSNPSNPIVTTGAVTRYTSHYYQYVRQGARRIGAGSNTGTFDPLAFVNVDGTYAVVVNAGGGGSFSVQGLPPGTYGIRFTTSAGSNSHADQTIGSGQVLTTSIPAAGVISIHRK